MRLSLFKHLQWIGLLTTAALLSACSIPVQLQQPLPNQSPITIVSHLGEPSVVLYTPDQSFGFIRSLFPASTNSDGVMQFKQTLPIIHLDYALNNMVNEQLRAQGYRVNFVSTDQSINENYIKAISQSTGAQYVITIQPYHQYIPQDPAYYNLDAISGFGMVYNYLEGRTYFFAAYKITIWDSQNLTEIAEANYAQSQVSTASQSIPLYWPNNYGQLPYQQVIALRNWLNQTMIPVTLAQIEQMMALGSISS